MTEWRQGLFGCFGNCSMCCLVYFSPVLAIGKNAEYVGEASSFLWVYAIMGAPCVAGALLRGLIRKKKGIDGSFWVDFGLWLCVPCCALCQETVETGSMDYLMTPELQAMNREAESATK